MILDPTGKPAETFRETDPCPGCRKLKARTVQSAFGGAERTLCSNCGYLYNAVTPAKES